MTKQEMQTEALDMAKNGPSVANYPAIFAGFMDKGIPEGEIEPRVNVFTYQAWQAKGRQVQRGETGVRVTTRIPMFREVDGERVCTGTRPKTATVFHVSQTAPASGQAAA